VEPVQRRPRLLPGRGQVVEHLFDLVPLLQQGAVPGEETGQLLGRELGAERQAPQQLVEVGELTAIVV